MSGVVHYRAGGVTIRVRLYSGDRKCIGIVTPDFLLQVKGVNPPKHSHYHCFSDPGTDTQGHHTRSFFRFFPMSFRFIRDLLPIIRGSRLIINKPIPPSSYRGKEAKGGCLWQSHTKN